MYLSGSKELDEDVSSNRGVVGDAKPLPRQRTSCDYFKTHRKLQPGHNPEVIDEAVELKMNQLLMPVTRPEH